MPTIRIVLAAALAVVPTAVTPDSPCRPERHGGSRYTVCTLDPARHALEILWGDAEGRPYGSFAAAAAAVARQGNRLAFAVNAGMYHPKLDPVGLLVRDGVELTPVNEADGEGNFFLKPNGVFWIGSGRAGVTTTGRWLAARPEGVRHATQSGPMLLVDGAPHPRFAATSTSRKIRNGVAVVGGVVVLAVSEDEVTFHDFAMLFRERFGARDALFLDGTVSGLYVPELGRADDRYPLGPILGVVERPQTVAP